MHSENADAAELMTLSLFDVVVALAQTSSNQSEQVNKFACFSSSPRKQVVSKARSLFRRLVPVLWSQWQPKSAAETKRQGIASAALLSAAMKREWLRFLHAIQGPLSADGLLVTRLVRFWLRLQLQFD